MCRKSGCRRRGAAELEGIPDTTERCADVQQTIGGEERNTREVEKSMRIVS
jgi:hypothetical protein